jgi:hypothetical protein
VVFGRVRDTALSFVMSVRTREATLLPLDGFDLSLIFEDLFQTLPRKYEGKAIPLQPWRGLEGFRSLRFPDFKTIGT